MKRPLLLLPLLALALPALAQDPATNAPILPAWLGDVRLGMSTNEFFARVPGAQWTYEAEGPSPWTVELKGQDGPMALWSFSFPDGPLERILAFSGEDRAVSAEERRALAAELAGRLGRPVGTRRLEIKDLGVMERIGWTNETALAALLSMTNELGPVFFVEMSREVARREKDAQELLRGLAPELVGPPPKLSPRDQAEAEAFLAEVERLCRPVDDCLRTGDMERARALALETDARLVEDDAPAAFWARQRLWQVVLGCDCFLGDETGFNAHLPVFEAFDASSPHVELQRAALADRLERDGEVEPLLRAALAKARHPFETGSIEIVLASFLARSEDRLDEALVLARHAVSVLSGPAGAGAWQAFGRVSLAKGELSEAKEALEKAMSLSAQWPTVLAGIKIDYALVLDAQGETNRVREILAELRSAPPILDRHAARGLADLEAKYPATPRPAEDTHAESAETAEPESHAQSAEDAE